MYPILPNEKGFTLIEVLMVVLLVTILAVASITVVPDTINESRFNSTVEKMNQIRNAMIGNPDIKEGTVRTSFGYLGDVGAVPSAITDLLTLPGGVSAYSVNASARFGLGWNGPYLSGRNTSSDFTKDAWGTAFVYTPGATPPTLVSLGADYTAGGTGFNQDITVTLPTELTTGTVSGFICQGGGPFASTAQVELNIPNGSGVLLQLESNLVPGDQGQFSFSAIPFGVRSVTVYIPSKVAATQTLGPIVISVAQPNVLIPCASLDISP
jgi:prepilin-type N-terminal cleavage/methylation domain-containing protein